MDTDGKTFSDLCRRRYANGPCEDSSMFRLWDHDTTKLQTALANGNQVKEQVSDLGQYVSEGESLSSSQPQSQLDVNSIVSGKYHLCSGQQDNYKS